MGHAWRRFWFAEGDARNLAAARIIIALHGLWILLSRDIPALSMLPAQLWYTARLEAGARFLLFPGMAHAERMVELAAVVLLLLVACGVAVRFAALAAALALYHLAPLQTLVATFDPINRGLTITTLCLVVLSASACADRWSLRPPREPADPREYGWPLRLMWLFVAQNYLFGAFGKLRYSGLEWFTADNLRRNLVLYLHMHPAVPDPWLAGLAGRPGLMGVAAIGVLILEASFVLALFSRRARRVLVPAALLMHLAILRTMRIVFANLFHLGLFVNWGWLADRVHGRRRHQSRMIEPASTGSIVAPRTAG